MENMLASLGTGALTTGQKSELALWLLMVFCGVLSYRIAVRTRRYLGVSPWRIPPSVWALVGAMFLLLGLLVETIARVTTRPARQEVGRGNDYDLLAQLAPRSETAGGATARFPAPEDRSHPTAPRPDDWPPPLFGWYADPSGRHEQRYWDGRHWSDRVSDGGQRADDALGEP